MIPLYKLFSLLLRVFSRPLINLTKRYHANNQIKSDFIRRLFFTLGRWFSQTQNNINRKYLKMAHQQTSKPLSEHQTIDKGIEFFYEILFYTIAIGFPMYQIYRQVVDTKAKERKLAARITSVSDRMEAVRIKTERVCELVAGGYGERRLLWLSISANYLLFLEYTLNQQVSQLQDLISVYCPLLVQGPQFKRYMFV